ncbi:MAG: abortive infection family protein [Candidatus Omnitrophica bacterium]|nr:abortive infection family protein [Candidatus Omnitrophota bacterium]MBU1852324.1 abortive infection family protein [Candidatus Omnitrophota bacterium]
MKWTRQNVEQVPSMSPFLEHLSAIEGNIAVNPTLCIEACKALIEGVCKTILTNKNVPFYETSTCSFLVKSSIEAVLQSEDSYRSDISELGRRIAGVAQKLEEIRNNTTFASHGMDALNPRLTETVAILGSKITDTICGFILNCYNNNRLRSPDHRIHYDDCTPFNEYFDEQNPLLLGVIPISASEALFGQDYEAYKAAYFEYLSNLESGEIVDEVINE